MPARTISPNPGVLPPAGWAMVSPTRPPRECSWCDEPLITRRGVIVCPTCDSLSLMPFVSKRDQGGEGAAA